MSLNPVSSLSPACESVCRLDDSQSLSLSFRTLACAFTTNVEPGETNQVALAHHFGVDARRIVQFLFGDDDELCVAVLDPFDVHHDPDSPDYFCPPGVLELYRDHLDELDWIELSANPGAIELLKEHLDLFDWRGLSHNPHPFAIAVLAAFPDMIDWCALSANAGAIDLLLAHPVEIKWRELSRNPHPRAIALLAANMCMIDWPQLSRNTGAGAIDLLAAHLDCIDWRELSHNPSAVELLRANPTQIDWSWLSYNRSAQAIELLRANQDTIDWQSPFMNPDVVDLFTARPTSLYHSIMSSSVPNAINHLWHNIDYRQVCEMSMDTSAIGVLAAHPDRIVWQFFCQAFYWTEHIE